MKNSNFCIFLTFFSIIVQGENFKLKENEDDNSDGSSPDIDENSTQYKIPVNNDESMSNDIPNSKDPFPGYSVPKVFPSNAQNSRDYITQMKTPSYTSYDPATFTSAQADLLNNRNGISNDFYKSMHMPSVIFEKSLIDPLSHRPAIEERNKFQRAKIEKYLKKPPSCKKSIESGMYRKLLINCECLQDAMGRILINMVEPEYKDVCKCYCTNFKEFTVKFGNASSTCDMCNKHITKENLLVELLSKSPTKDKGTVNGFPLTDLRYDFLHSDYIKQVNPSNYNDGVFNVPSFWRGGSSGEVYAGGDYNVFPKTHPLFGNETDADTKKSLVYNFYTNAQPQYLQPTYSHMRGGNLRMTNVQMKYNFGSDKPKDKRKIEMTKDNMSNFGIVI